jgi:hypothetical protein
LTPPREVAGEGQESLVVDVAAQLGLALDRDQRAPAGTSAGGDPDGVAEGVVPQLDDRQTVDLTDPFSVEVKQQRALPHHLVEVALDHVRAPQFLLDRALDML